jgi:tetratricopeptide (TPR) repeat protein
LVRYLTESGGITKGEKGWEVKDPALVQLPDSVKAVVEERLERLGEETAGVLTWASVVGREFTLSLLKEVTGLEEDKLLDVVDNAVAARVLTPRLSLGQEAYSFVDQQARDVLYERIGPARRRRHHLKVGQAMEKAHDGRLDEYYDALAHHFLQGTDLQKAAEYAAKAGDRASTIYTWGRASAHYQTALELLEDLKAGAGQQAELLAKLGLVTGLGRGKGSLGYYEKALSLYLALGDHKKAGEVHLRLAEQYQFHEAGAQDFEKAYSHGQKAVALLEREGESPELAQAYARLGLIVRLMHRDPPSVANELTEKGLAIAERLGDPVAIAEAGRFRGRGMMRRGEIKKGLELLCKSYEAARTSGYLGELTSSACALAFFHSILADGNSALQWADQAADAAKQVGIIRYQIYSASLQARASIIKGDIERSLSSLERAEQLARSGGIELTQISGYSIHIPPFVYFFLGEWEKAETWLKKLSPRPVPGIQKETMAVIHMEQGKLISAKTLLRESARSSEAWVMNELISCALLAEITAKDGELEEAEAHLHRAKEILSNGEDWHGLAAQVHLAEGIVATTAKKWEEAEEAFKKTQEVHSQYPFPYYEAKCLVEREQMYMSRNGPGDRERGMQLLDQALSIFQRIQAKKMVEKVLAHKQVLEA